MANEAALTRDVDSGSMTKNEDDEDNGEELDDDDDEDEIETQGDVVDRDINCILRQIHCWKRSDML